MNMHGFEIKEHLNLCLTNVHEKSQTKPLWFQAQKCKQKQAKNQTTHVHEHCLPHNKRGLPTPEEEMKGRIYKKQKRLACAGAPDENCKHQTCTSYHGCAVAGGGQKTIIVKTRTRAHIKKTGQASVSSLMDATHQRQRLHP